MIMDTIGRIQLMSMDFGEMGCGPRRRCSLIRWTLVDWDVNLSVVVDSG
jgi:hypothetical protein